MIIPGNFYSPLHIMICVILIEWILNALEQVMEVIVCDAELLEQTVDLEQLKPKMNNKAYRTPNLLKRRSQIQDPST